MRYTLIAIKGLLLLGMLPQAALAAAGGCGKACMEQIADRYRAAYAAHDAKSLPLARGVSALVCPGPETLAVPDGAEAVAPGGPVLLRAMLVGPEGAGAGTFAAAAGTVGPMLPAGQAAAAPVTLKPAAGSPKKMKKSCTMKGVLRIAST